MCDLSAPFTWIKTCEKKALQFRAALRYSLSTTCLIYRVLFQVVAVMRSILSSKFVSLAILVVVVAVGTATCQYGASNAGPDHQQPVSEDPHCTYLSETAFEDNAALDKFRFELPLTSREHCCEVCRATPQCHVSMYVQWNGVNHGKLSDWNVTGSCWLRGLVNTSLPTHKANTTACVVKARPEPPTAPPAAAKNVLYVRTPQTFYRAGCIGG